MRWQHCAEIAFISLVFASAILVVLWAAVAIAKAYRIAKPLRANSPPDKIADRSTLSKEQREEIDRHWQTVRDRSKAYTEDLGRTAAQLRRDGIEYLKEGQHWGRLGVQYALIGNAGALGALPYLLSWQRSTTPAIAQLTVGDVTWSAIWLAGGLLMAALVCAIAYLDFQVNTAISWNDLDVEQKLAAQRHYDTEIGGQDLPLRQQIRAELRTVSVRTSLAGLYLALLAWFSLAWGTIRLIVSLQG